MGLETLAEPSLQCQQRSRVVLGQGWVGEPSSSLQTALVPSAVPPPCGSSDHSPSPRDEFLFPIVLFPVVAPAQVRRRQHEAVKRTIIEAG